MKPQKLADLFDCFAFVETIYWKTDMCKSESSQSHERRAQLADYSKTCGKPKLLIVVLL